MYKESYKHIDIYIYIFFFSIYMYMCILYIEHTTSTFMDDNIIISTKDTNTSYSTQLYFFNIPHGNKEKKDYRSEKKNDRDRAQHGSLITFISHERRSCGYAGCFSGLISFHRSDR